MSQKYTQKNRVSVLGITTDTIIKDGKIVLDKGKRQCGAIGWYRVMSPLGELGYETQVGMKLKAKAEDAIALKKRGDIWFSKMSDNEGIDNIYAAHKEFSGAKFVLDLDDDPDHVNYDHPDLKALDDRKEMRLRMVKMADHVVCSTEQIKESIKHINPYATVIPNAMNPKIWDFKNNIKGKKIKIGWISSGSHFADVPVIQPVMDIILKKYPNVEFHFAGMTWDEVKENGYYHHVGVRAYKDFPKWYANQGYDIAIAPLKDTQFNRCKSNIKWMEAAMLEIPCVASDVTPYKCIKHGTDGFLASTTDQWVKYLSLLIEDKQRRIEVGKNAKESVLRDWHIDKFLPEYIKLFDKLSDTKSIAVVTAITANKDKLIEQPQYQGVEYLAFTKQKSETWKTEKPCEIFKKGVMNAKIHKILTHKYTDAEYIVWIDGNLTLKADPHELVKVMKEKDFAFFKHPYRTCLYQEAEACVEYGKVDPRVVAEQVKEYAKEGFPEGEGLSEMTCFVRRNNEKTNKLFEQWWADICRYSHRDQVSFPKIFKDEKWNVIPGSVAFLEGEKHFVGNDYFDYKKHKKL